MNRRTPDAAQSITSAPDPLAVDQARRARRYLIQMGIRVVCFLLAVLLWRHVPLWVSLLLIVAAVVLPYVAVLFANAGRERRDDAPVGVLPLLDAGPPGGGVAGGGSAGEGAVSGGGASGGDASGTGDLGTEDIGTEDIGTEHCGTEDLGTGATGAEDSGGEASAAGSPDDRPSGATAPGPPSGGPPPRSDQHTDRADHSRGGSR